MPAGKLIVLFCGFSYALIVGGVMPHSLRSTGLPILLSWRSYSKTAADCTLATKPSRTTRHARIVPPLVGIPDFIHHCVQLFLALLLGLRSHPVDLLDILSHG